MFLTFKADMQRFVENYSSFMQESGVVAKHVTLMTEMSHVIDRRSLMNVSALEQSLACENDHKSATSAVEDILRDNIDFEDKLRIVMLYGLRYEKDLNNIPKFRNRLRECARTEAERKRVAVWL